MKRKNRGPNDMTNLLLEMNESLADLLPALYYIRNGCLSSAYLQTLQNGLQFLGKLKETDLRDLSKIRGVEVLETLQQKMQTEEFQTTISFLQKCLVDSDELTNEEFREAESFLEELQGTLHRSYLEKPGAAEIMESAEI